MNTATPYAILVLLTGMLLGGLSDDRVSTAAGHMPSASPLAPADFLCKTNDLRRVENHAAGSLNRDVALAMKSEEVLPGEVASARLFNRGKSRAGYGVGLRIERFESGRWSLDPASPKGPWPKKLGRLDPGNLSTCFRFSVPIDQQAGRYRFTVHVHLDQKPAYRSALFQVYPDL